MEKVIANMSIDRRVTRSLSNELQARTQDPISLLQSNFERREAMNREPSGLVRNNSGETFLRSLVEGSMGMVAPNMEGTGFTNNFPQTMRLNSEELFHNWISDAESQGSGQNHSSHRTRQAPCRMSNELSSLLQQSDQTFNQVDSFEHFPQSSLFSDDNGWDATQLKSTRNAGVEREDQAIELSPVKRLSWFQQSRPMTRSRSSELRRRYAAMQGMPPPPTVETPHRQSMQGTQKHKDEFPSIGALKISANGGITQPPLVQQVHQSSIPKFNMPLHGTGSSVSTVVSMLKGTLERKKLGTNQQWQQHQNTLNDAYPFQWRVQDELFNRLANPEFQTAHKVDSPRAQLPTATQMHSENNGQLLTIAQMNYDGQTQMGGPTTNAQIQPALLSCAPSPSNSSGGAPVLSTGEDQCNSGQTYPNHDNILKRAAVACADIEQQPKRQNSIGNHPSPSSIGAVNSETQLERIQKTELSKKPPNLSRAGSITSSGGSGFTLDKEDPTKKRRVERQRKMAEAKGRISVPAMPSDLQAALKRCDALEKEVRSLKLNLAFMNRKDSEQTKQIEELQAQNDELQEERERLIDELGLLESRTSGAD